MPLISPGSEQFESLVRWLVARQTAELGEEDDEDEEDSSNTENPVDSNVQDLPDAVDGLSLDKSIDMLPSILPPTEESLQWAGFNGRSNKYADTCYSFWNSATLVVSATAKLQPQKPS